MPLTSPRQVREGGAGVFFSARCVKGHQTTVEETKKIIEWVWGGGGGVGDTVCGGGVRWLARRKCSKPRLYNEFQFNVPMKFHLQTPTVSYHTVYNSKENGKSYY